MAETERCPKCGQNKVGYCIDLDDRPTGELFCVLCGTVWPEVEA